MFTDTVGDGSAANNVTACVFVSHAQRKDPFEVSSPVAIPFQHLEVLKCHL